MKFKQVFKRLHHRRASTKDDDDNTSLTSQFPSGQLKTLKRHPFKEKDTFSSLTPLACHKIDLCDLEQPHQNSIRKNKWKAPNKNATPKIKTRSPKHQILPDILNRSLRRKKRYVSFTFIGTKRDKSRYSQKSLLNLHTISSEDELSRDVVFSYSSQQNHDTIKTEQKMDVACINCLSVYDIVTGDKRSRTFSLCDDLGSTPDNQSKRIHGTSILPNQICANKCRLLAAPNLTDDKNHVTVNKYNSDSTSSPVKVKHSLDPHPPIPFSNANVSKPNFNMAKQSRVPPDHNMTQTHYNCSQAIMAGIEESIQNNVSRDHLFANVENESKYHEEETDCPYRNHFNNFCDSSRVWIPRYINMPGHPHPIPQSCTFLDEDLLLHESSSYMNEEGQYTELENVETDDEGLNNSLIHFYVNSDETQELCSSRPNLLDEHFYEKVGGDDNENESKSMSSIINERLTRLKKCGNIGSNLNTSTDTEVEHIYESLCEIRFPQAMVGQEFHDEIENDNDDTGHDGSRDDSDIYVLNDSLPISKCFINDSIVNINEELNVSSVRDSNGITFGGKDTQVIIIPTNEVSLTRPHLMYEDIPIILPVSVSSTIQTSNKTTHTDTARFNSDYNIISSEGSKDTPCEYKTMPFKHCGKDHTHGISGPATPLNTQIRLRRNTNSRGSHRKGVNQPTTTINPSKRYAVYFDTEAERLVQSMKLCFQNGHNVKLCQMHHLHDHQQQRQQQVLLSQHDCDNVCSKMDLFLQRCFYAIGELCAAVVHPRLRLYSNNCDRIPETVSSVIANELRMRQISSQLQNRAHAVPFKSPWTDSTSGPKYVSSYNAPSPTTSNSKLEAKAINRKNTTEGGFNSVIKPKHETELCPLLAVTQTNEPPPLPPRPLISALASTSTSTSTLPSIPPTPLLSPLLPPPLPPLLQLAPHVPPSPPPP